MPAGERSQTWYPEIVELLRSNWRSELELSDVLGLREHLQEAMMQLRRRRGIVSATVRCRCCGTTGPGADPVISVRALLLSVRRFGIDSAQVVAAREREWMSYRRQHHLDRFGKPLVMSGDTTSRPRVPGVLDDEAQQSAHPDEVRPSATTVDYMQLSASCRHPAGSS
jgi:hypothetical protein